MTTLQRRRGAVDLVLANIVMPRMGGLELATRMRAMHHPARLLYLSGYAPDSIRQQADLHERGEILQKPFTPGVLLRKVRDVLDEGRRSPAS